VRTEAYKLYGVDVTQIPGVDGIAIPIFSEVGRDLTSPISDCPTVCFLAGIMSDNDKSGGKVLWTGVRRINNRAAQMFRLAANSLHHNRTPLGDFLRPHESQARSRQGALQPLRTRSRLSFYTLVTNKSSMTRPSGQPETSNGGSDSRTNQAPKPVSLATSSCQSKPHDQCSP